MARALVSVSDKTGVVACAERLAEAGFELVATGGTARVLREAGLVVADVSDLTGFPEILDGRVKTLHPAIHAGLLARRDRSDHLRTIAEHEIVPIDVLVANLYPFAEMVSSPTVTDEAAIEQIDIGGPAMIRAAAKNYPGVVVLVDPADYEGVLVVLEEGGPAALDTAARRYLAAKAFAHVSRYDSLIAAWLRTAAVFPTELTLGGTLLATPRYGENPHQPAAVYTLSQPGGPAGVASWGLVQGEKLSYNNYLDASAAWHCVLAFERPAVAIVKHTVPCGLGQGEVLAEAYERALSGDPVSAFGGVMAANRRIDEETVRRIGKQRLDIIIAPGFDEAALERLSTKKNLRLVEVGDRSPAKEWDVRSIPGGLLVQEPDSEVDDPAGWRTVTVRAPDMVEWETLDFAWRVARQVKSNAIVLAQPDVVVGVGAGQPNRVESVRLAVRVAGERAVGSVLASDAFFPFPDGIEAAAEAGVTAIVQPGGSVRDDECIAAANAHDIAMVFTGRRHFRH
jgi:phosphoribosylaminoimidazolecarboxamide formyltransferase/IMP cyclohydrolase